MKIQQIDKIFCINLNHRLDRKHRCEEIFKKYDFSVEFFTAIDGKNLNIEAKIKSGNVGCCLSHREIYRKFSNSNWNNILILEDDVELVEDFVDLFNLYYREVPDDWHLLYLGGNHINTTKNMISEHIHKLRNTYTTHCYLLNRKVIPFLLTEFNDSNIYTQEVDVHLSNIQKQIPCYGVTPHLAWQRASFSDIEENYVDYSFLKPKEAC